MQYIINHMITLVTVSAYYVVLLQYNHRISARINILDFNTMTRSKLRRPIISWPMSGLLKITFLEPPLTTIIWPTRCPPEFPLDAYSLLPFPPIFISVSLFLFVKLNKNSYFPREPLCRITRTPKSTRTTSLEPLDKIIVPTRKA